MGLLAGALLCVGADAWLARNEEMASIRRMQHAAACGVRSRSSDLAETARGRAIAAGTVVDGIPESLSLGLMAAQATAGPALLLAVLVLSISVLPHAFREASRPVAVVATAGLALGYVLGA